MCCDVIIIVCAVSPFLFVLLLVGILLLLLTYCLLCLLIALVGEGSPRVDGKLLDFVQFLNKGCFTSALHFFITIW